MSAERKQSKIPFVNLHCHSTFSIFDGYGQPKQFLEAAWENGMNSCALSEHGNMNSFSHLFLTAEEMNKNGKNIKPIFAIESYYIPSMIEWRKQYKEEKEKEKNKKEDDSNILLEDDQALKKGNMKGKRGKRAHLLLIAKNLIGLKNLFKLVSISYTTDCYYYYPRMDRDMLRQHSEGIIATSSCIGSYWSQLYHQNKSKGQDIVIEKLREETQIMLDIFGDDFYGELQWNALPEQHIMNQFIIQLSYEYGFKLISTVDAHYPKKEDWLDRELYRRLGWLSKTNKPSWYNKLPKSTDEIGFELYVKNGDEVWDSYKKYSKKCNIEYDNELILKSIEETHKIAFEKIENFKPDCSVKLPSFVVPEGKTAEQHLTRLCLDALKEKGFANKPEYVERLKNELLTIKNRGFAKYFLAVKAITDKAQETQLLGVSRGSSGGSLTAYLLDIIQINPLVWNTQFERFLLKKDKGGYPDIDTDFEDPVTLKEIFKETWGEYSVVQVSNFNTLQIKSLVKDISKFYDVPFEKINDVTMKIDYEAIPKAKIDHNIISGVYSCTYEEYKKYSPTFQKFLEKYPQIGERIQKLHGQIRSIGAHASGTLITENLNEHLPLIKVGGKIQTPFVEGQTNRHLEKLGFIKQDILGLNSLSVISNCIKLILQRHYNIEKPVFQDIKKFYNEKLHPDKINFNDQEVWKYVFEEGNFVGVFQFTGRFAQEFCKKVKPKNIKELSDVTAIERPATLSSKVDIEYLAVKNGEKQIEYLCKELEEVLDKTAGCCVYQEQVAEIVAKMGDGLTLEDGNKLRKLIVKKGIQGSSKEKEKQKIIKKFKDGCIKKKLTEQQTDELLKSLENFAGYGFNYSHSCSYAIISYQCAYLLTKYKIEWCTVFLNRITIL